MAERSEYARYVRGLATQVAADRFADAAACRDALVNNTNHLLDIRSNVIANFEGSWVVYESDEGSDRVAFYALPEIRYPLTILASGRSALVVPYLRAKVDAGSAAIRVQLEPLTGIRRYATDEAVSEVTVTSTTGEDLAPDPIYVPADLIGDALDSVSSPYHGSVRDMPSIDGDGDSATCRFVMVAIRVWADTSSGLPTLMGLTLREHIPG